jgi:hypothetical protein
MVLIPIIWCSFSCYRRKLLAWLVWGPLLLLLTVLFTPWLLSGSLLWLLVSLLSPGQRNLTRLSLDRYRYLQYNIW